MASDADVYQHANGPPSRLARIAGDKRCSKEPREKDSTAQAASSFLLRSFGLRVSHVPRAHLKSVARGRRALGLSGSALEAERRGITRSSLRRTELESSLHSKRKKRAALKAHRAWQRLQGQPLRRARTALAVFVLVCRILKTRCRSRKATSRLREASASIRFAGVNGGLIDTTVFAKAAWHRIGEKV